MVSTKISRKRAKSERVKCQKSEREPTDMFVVSSKTPRTLTVLLQTSRWCKGTVVIIMVLPRHCYNLKP